MSIAAMLLNKQLAFTGLAVVALQLGSMEGQSDILRGRHLPFGPQTKGNLDALLGATIFIAWMVCSVWLFRTWPWYAWLATTVAMMLLARQRRLSEHLPDVVQGILLAVRKIPRCCARL